MFVQLAREDFELIGKLRKMTNDRVDRVIVKISLDFIYIYIYIYKLHTKTLFTHYTPPIFTKLSISILYFNKELVLQKIYRSA
jgi:hypothetical protein